MRVAIALSLALAGLLLGGASASAAPPFLATCGLVRALTAPTTSAPGSITIGDRTFTLTASDQVSSSAVGSVRCLTQTTTTSGPVLTLAALPSPLCGEIFGGILENPSGRFLDVIVEPGFHISILAAPSVRLPEGTTTTAVACFETTIDAAGRAVATRIMGAVVTPRPPSTPTLRPAAGLPSTSTDASLAAAALAAAAAALVALATRLRR